MSVLRVTEGLVEINEVHHGDVEIRGGVAVVRGRVTGHVDVRGGKVVISGIVDGNVTNLGGHAHISGSVLGSITGSPDNTIIDITDGAERTFAGWDPIAEARPAAQRRGRRPNARRAAGAKTSSAGRITIFSAIAATLAGAATIAAMAMAGGNTPVDADGVNPAKVAHATVWVVEKN